MKKLVVICLLLILVLSACGPKPYYETRTGKKKLKYYNDVFYGRQKQGTTP
jgi:hypothetical protein